MTVIGLQRTYCKYPLQSLVKLAITIITISQLFSHTSYNVAFIECRDGDDELRRAETCYTKLSNSGKLHMLPFKVCIKSMETILQTKIMLI